MQIKTADSKAMLSDLREALAFLGAEATEGEAEAEEAIGNIKKQLAGDEATLIDLDMRIGELEEARTVSLQSSEDLAITAMAKGEDPEKAFRELGDLKQDREGIVNHIEMAKRGLHQYQEKRSRASQEKIEAAFAAALDQVKPKYREDLERVLQEVEKAYFQGWNNALEKALKEVGVGTGGVGWPVDRPQIQC